MPALLNFIASQIVWLLSLYGAGTGRHWLGSVGFLVFLLAQLRMSAAPVVDAKAALVAAGFGLVLDTGYAQAGLLEYAAPLPVSGIAPYWILVMWANFGLTLNSSLAWLERNPWVGAMLGATAGPLAYLAGIELGAARATAPPPLAYGVLGATWAVALPVLLWAAGRLAAQHAARSETR
jgi:hypothetical protein